MSYLTAFCNITTDLQAIVSDIDRYDRKRVLMSNWSNPSTNLYRLSNTGYIENLYKDGVEMTKVTCSTCKVRCEVPFKPTSSKPIYCDDCFNVGYLG